MSSYYYGKKQIQNGVFNDNKFNYTEKPVSYGSIDLIVQENDNTDQEQTDLINNVITAANQLNTLVSANTLYQSKTDVLETNFNAVDGRITTIENTPTADNTALITDIWTNSNAISVINTINNTQTTNIANLQTYDTTNTENINLINTDISNIQEKTNLITKNNLQLEFNEDIKMIKKFKCDSTGQLGPSNNRIMLGTNLFSANNGLELYFDNVNDKAIINGKKAGALHTLEINGHNLNDFDTRINTLEIQPAFDNSTNVGDLTTLTTGQSLQLTMINNNINDITNNTSNITTNLNSINAINTGISNIDNTTDLLKPISTATTTQLNLKASQTDLNTTNTNVTNNLNLINTINTNISNLDNTTDLLKPVSTATTTQLNLKASQTDLNTTNTNVTNNLNSINTVNATLTNKADITFVNNEINNLLNSSPESLNTLNELAAALGNDENFSTTMTNLIALKAPLTTTNSQTINITQNTNDILTLENNEITQNNNIATINSNISNVNNTTDLLKPVSTATTTQLNLKASQTDLNTTNTNVTNNLNSINTINTNISNLDNTTDLLKPVSTATTTQLNLKASQTDLNTTNTNVTNNLNSINTINTNISNLDNTTDLLKPVSTEAQTALNLKLDSSYVQNVTSTEHNYLSNVTSNIQSQLNAISATSYDDTTVKADISANTANIATNTTNINNKLNSSYVQNVTSNEHSYLSNVTSNIQTQFNNISNYDDTPVNTNATNIATNTTNIATNTTNITGKQANQTGNKTTLGSNAINNNAHGTVIGYNTKCSGSSIVIGSGCCKTYGAQNTSVIIGGDACYYGNLMNKSVIIGHNTAASYGGSNCTAIGYDAGTGNSPHTLGASSTDKIILGDNNITTAYIAVAWSVVSDIRDKCNISSCDCLGLDFINGIDVIKYKKNDRSRYCTTLNNKEDGVFETTQQTNDGSKKDEKFTIGVSAQQIQTLENQLNSECADNMIVNDDDADKLSVRYQNLIMPLINAVKELTYMNTDLLARIEVLENA